ncbi:hypothetical protein [Butyrivibrio sp. VCB2006]|uniref:hypothetical protein n=1 Tax=Butyrivibrio sp. VCB2006 TaxID=1280679 RepID=UPI0004922C44|nr:hypothetical protein [Butyrivibrio sp. VCB2006]
MRYEYDFRYKDVLIRKRGNGLTPEILHKGDTKWSELIPRPDYKDESYARAVYLGQGCWENLETISDEEAEDILKSWGYDVNPPVVQ